MFSEHESIRNVRFSYGLNNYVSIDHPFGCLPSGPYDILIQLRAPIYTLTMTVEASGALVFSPTRFHVFNTFHFRKRVPTMAFTSGMLGNGIGPTNVTFRVNNIGVVASESGPNIMRKGCPLGRVSNFGTIATGPKRIFCSGTIGLPNLSRHRGFLCHETLGVHAYVTIVGGFRRFTIVPFQRQRNLFPRSRFLIKGARAFDLGILRKRASVGNSRVFFIRNSATFP